MDFQHKLIKIIMVVLIIIGALLIGLGIFKDFNFKIIFIGIVLAFAGIGAYITGNEHLKK